MVAAIPAEIKQEVDLEIAISNRNHELMTKRWLSGGVCTSVRPTSERGYQVAERPAQFHTADNFIAICILR